MPRLRCRAIILLVFELIAVLRGTVGDDDIHVVAYPQIYLPKGEQSFLASFFSNPAGGHIAARPDRSRSLPRVP